MLSVVPGTTGTALVKVEDAAHEADARRTAFLRHGTALEKHDGIMVQFADQSQRHDLDGFARGIVHVAQALGQDPARGFKTLVARGASKGVYVFEVPVAENLDLKKAARAVGAKSIELLHVAEINAVTGYIRGGCSPIGMKKQYPTVFHETVTDYDTVFISGGKIGAQVEVAPKALLELLRAGTADIITEEKA